MGAKSRTTARGDRGFARSWVGPILAAASLVVLVAWWEVRIDIPPRTPVMTSYLIDQYDIYGPTPVYAAEELLRGHVPLWDPYRAAGLPHLAIQMSNSFYPPNLLYLALPKTLANKIILVFHYWVAFLGTVYYARTLRLSWTASTVAGLGYAFCGVMQWFLVEFPFLHHCALIPVAAGVAETALADGRRRWFVALGILMASNYLAGHPSFFLMAAYMIGAAFVARAFALARAGEWRAIGTGAISLAGAGALTVLLAAWHLLPFLQAAFLSPRRPGGLTVEMADYLIGMVTAKTIGISLTAAGPNKFSYFILGYLGILTLLLLPFAFIHRERGGRVLFFAAIAAVAGILSVGTATPVYGWFFDWVPSISLSRAPFYFLVMASFGAAMLAAYATDAIISGERHRAAIALWIAVGGAALYFGLLIDLHDVFGASVVFGYGAYEIIHTSQVFAVIGALLIGVCVLLRAPRARRVAGVLLPAFLGADLLLTFQNSLPIFSTSPDFFRAPPELGQAVRRLQGFDRTYFHRRPDVYGFAPEGPTMLPNNIGMLERVYDIGSYENILPIRWTRYYAYMERGPSRIGGVEGSVRTGAAGITVRPTTPQGKFRLDASQPWIRLLDFLSVRYIVVGAEDTFVGDGVPAERYPLIETHAGFEIRENPHAVPRAYVVSDTELIADEERLFERLVDPDFDPLRSAVVEEPVADLPSGGDGGDARITRYDHEHIVVEAESRGGGLLVLTDQVYPDWHATLDGAPAETHRVNYLFRGVVLPPGRHTVVFRYRPTAFVYGGALTLLTAASLAFATALHLRRVRGEERHAA